MSSTVRKRYRQTPHGDMYTLEFRQQSDGHFDIYAIESPPNPQNTSVSICHLCASGKVCVAAGKEPRTLDRALAIAFIWIDGYSAYIRTGVFPMGAKKVNV